MCRGLFCKSVALATFLIGLFSCQTEIVLVDPNGKEYPTVRIGESVWMNENLSYNISNGSFCYDDDILECDSMGRLYTWEAALNAADQIPGWHLPSKEEWEALISHYGGDSLAYECIMTGECEFKPQSAGVRLSSGYYVAKKFQGVNYWSSSVSDTSEIVAYSVAFMRHIEKISPHNYPITNACSVRLVKDQDN